MLCVTSIAPTATENDVCVDVEIQASRNGKGWRGEDVYANESLRSLTHSFTPLSQARWRAREGGTLSFMNESIVQVKQACLDSIRLHSPDSPYVAQIRSGLAASHFHCRWAPSRPPGWLLTGELASQ